MAMPQQAGVSGLDGQQNLLATVSGNVQKYAAKKKKVLTAEEMELYELTQAAGIVMDQEVFKIIVDLLKMNVAPLAVFQMLKAMCAGHSIAEMSSAEAVSTMTRSNLADSRVRNKSNAAISGSQLQTERSSSREGSSQRVPRQPSATRAPKGSSTGKNTAGGSSTQPQSGL
ncbi:mitotic-spindle organizing protein 2 isoform X3 [Callorhinchus milii]|uniref:Mitotic-spindle organizing protein 2B n=1 Tax=Callorhinchus milii TaxID=7868 RepID=V9KWJ9_CALMI|nr:mitotic-spindle organizing protein 2 isoform X3 [Callorhinchus milii]|eukprot:gi/632979813/ref/XP_007906680.1/ PREDICTED: mitotic-spindle organizing protein 2B-like isoform X3 [Callorhinchus milii]